MGVVLLILKIVGIILAAIILLLLIILALPFSYRSEGVFREEKKAFLKAHSFLWILGAKVFYENNEAGYVVRLFGIPVLKDALFSGEKSELYEDEDYYEEPEKKKKFFFKRKEKEEYSEENKSNAGKYTATPVTVIYNPETDEENTSKIKTVFEKIIGAVKKTAALIRMVLLKIREILVKITVFLLNIPKKIAGFFNVTGRLKEKYRKFKRLYKSKGFKRALVYTKETLFKVIKHIKPKKAEAYLKVGFDGPDKTGEMVGILSMLYGMNYFKKEKFEIVPDFENKVLEGNYKISGRFVLGYLAIIALKFYFKREIQFVIKQFKRINAS